MKLDGKLIKWHRNKNRLTQEQLAENICSVTQLSKIENNQIKANDEILVAIAQRLKIPEMKLTNSIEPNHEEMVHQFLTAIHEHDIPNAKKLNKKISELNCDELHYDIEFLCILAQFGYLLMMKELRQADELHELVAEYDEIFEEVDPYSFHKFIGDYLINKGFFIDARSHLLQAKSLIPDHEDPELYILLAVVNSHLENILTSNGYARRALRILQEKLYYSRIIECEIILSSNHTFVNEYNVAKEQLDRLVSLIDQKFDPNSTVKIYFHLSLIHVVSRNFEEAIRLLNKNLELNVNQTELMHSRYLLAHAYYLMREERKAFDLIEKGESIAKEHELNYYLVKFKVLKLIIEEKEKELVEYLTKRAIPFFRLTGQAFDLRYYYQLLGHTLYKMKKYKKAAEIFMAADEQRKRFFGV
ncbi:helix-turn-helix domain-containing protein [Piscibacillus halophilus]|uniref:Tetratricopeptide repeat-containing protein n=1 Tax=Piscibacillus halophilus TaxID=571933 RepID=A0A1H9E474_9BACI|nr:helix-turn-helix transcriptional regulator [Piscibacillus halophilus]SEQ20063.1 Tetratricopeptide repeat-containing protein [Piscibacillus halophilus]